MKKLLSLSIATFVCISAVVALKGFLLPKVIKPQSPFLQSQNNSSANNASDAQGIFRLPAEPSSQPASSPNSTTAKTSVSQPSQAPVYNLSTGGSPLTHAGIILLTNGQRKQNGNLAALTENSQLDRAAELKLKDLFDKQYFEHISPTGVGPKDLANTVGYGFVEVGENLALGDFSSDQDVVDAWMASPGHRANILNAKFQEMGAAAAQGIYQGKTVWIAVQEFGKPLSSCPYVDPNLKIQITSLQAEADGLNAQIVPLKSQIDGAHPQSQADYDSYNALINQYNNLVANYNNRIDNLKLITSQYNSEVAAYNLCAQ